MIDTHSPISLKPKVAIHYYASIYPTLSRLSPAMATKRGLVTTIGLLPRVGGFACIPSPGDTIRINSTEYKILAVWGGKTI